MKKNIMSNIKNVDHISLAVNSIKKGIYFYTNVFEYRVIFEEDNMTKQIQSITGLKEISCNIVQLKSDFVGNVLELIEFKNYQSINTQISHPLYPGCAHIGFIVKVQNLDFVIIFIPMSCVVIEMLITRTFYYFFIYTETSR